MKLSTEHKLALRAAINEWISDRFPAHRYLLAHELPRYVADSDAWAVELTTKSNGKPARALGSLLVSHDASILSAPNHDRVLDLLTEPMIEEVNPDPHELTGRDFEFRWGDGIAAASRMADQSVDLLLTDPPYGISRHYVSEQQVPRRLLKNGNDFIMPKGYFGEWDEAIEPRGMDERGAAEGQGVGGHVLCTGADWDLLRHLERRRLRGGGADGVAEDEPGAVQPQAQARQRLGGHRSWEAVGDSFQRTHGAQRVRLQVTVAAAEDSPDAEAAPSSGAVRRTVQRGGRPCVRSLRR